VKKGEKGMGVISFIISFAIFIGVLKIIALPFKIIMKFIINSLLAGLVLALLAYFGVIVILNGWIIVLSAVFGIPGLIIGLIISMFI